MPDQQFWDTHYREQQTGWDLGAVSAPLKAYIDQLQDKEIRILIPGAGNSYEARYLLEKGFRDVTILDIAPTVIERLKSQLEPSSGDRLHILQGDFFRHQGSYDLILEQTFFCAIEPAQRTEYARHCSALLAPGGKVAGLLFNRDFEPGHPPFGGNADHYEQIFSPYFELKTWQSCYNSHPARAGSEWFMILKKKAAEG